MTYDGKPQDNLTSAAQGLFDAYADLDTYKIWPINAGMIDQSARFKRALDIITVIKHKYNEIENDEAETKSRQRRMSG